MKDITKILSNITLTDEQIEALDQFFEGYSKKLKKAAFMESAQEVKKVKRDAEKAFNLFKEDAEKAFNLFAEDADKAFQLFEKDAEKAFKLYQEDLQKEYTQYMVEAIEDLYSDIENRVKNDFMESKEWQAIDKIKSALQPLIISEDEKAMLDKLALLEQEKAALTEEKQELDRHKIITTLLTDFPAKYVESVKKFISAAKTNDEIYERFDSMLEMLEIDLKDAKNYDESGDQEAMKTLTKKKSQTVKKPVIEERKKVKRNNPYVESIFNTETKETLNKKQSRNKFFTEEEEALINLVFPQAI